MEFRKELYLGEEAEKHYLEYRNALKRGKPYPELYAITYAVGEGDQLDIVNGMMLTIKSVRERLPQIVGIAKGKEEALKVVRRIAEETFRATGTCDMRAYLSRL
ncbi:MAG: hypothetical protein U0L49_03060 [Eubacterium sp.]|nr:hypothetical protein [Eubacterium sp.]